MDVTIIRDKVRRMSGDATGLVMIKDTDIFGWIDEAQLEILRVIGESHSTTGGAASAAPYALPADWLKTKRVTYDGNPLKPCTIEDLEYMGIDPSENPNVPAFYYHTDGFVNLYPDPTSSDSKTVSIIYSKAPTTIASLATALTVKLAHHVDVLNFVMSRAYEKMNKDKLSVNSMNMFRESLAQRIQDATQYDDTYPIIRDDLRDIYG